jgi:hypothetical protein
MTPAPIGVPPHTPVFVRRTPSRRPVAAPLGPAG